MKILYKYCSISINSLSAISNSYLFFSKPENFNDPFDSQLNMLLYSGASYLLGSMEKLNMVREKIGVTCFSDSNDNQHMWAHYASRHQGICIGYDVTLIEEYFSRNALGIEAVKVNYISELPQLSAGRIRTRNINNEPITYDSNKFSSDSKEFDKLIQNLLLIKDLNIWAIENEWRIVAHPRAILVGKEIQKVTEISAGYKFHIPINSIKSIYFGINISDENITLVKSILPSIEFYKMEHKGEWKFHSTSI